MYKLIKDRGYTSTVIVKNTDTNAEVNLGPLSVPMKSILERAGFIIYPDSDATLHQRDAWNTPIDKAVADELLALTFRMGKPKKAKIQKEPTKEPTEKPTKKPIDALDIIFNLNS